MTSVNVNVVSTGDLWLAGMPQGSIDDQYDSAPAESPTLMPLSVTPGDVLTFTATGLVANGPVGQPFVQQDGPDGGSFTSHRPGSDNGIANTNVPYNSLVGVFLTNNQPNLSPAPSELDFSLIGTNFTTLSPQTGQAFFIGDGLTGTGSGAVQQFVVPQGATRLFLGTMDAYGWDNNVGSFTVTVTEQLPAQTYRLTSGVDTVAGGPGNDTILASSGTLTKGDNIDGGPGTNNLSLQSSGVFDLSAPTTLTNISIVNAAEGQAQSPNGAIPSTRQAITLRNGTSFTIDVASDTAVNAKNPNAPGIIIQGANNSDVINLGSGNDTVYVGGNSETINGGGGNNTFYISAATDGATINGGSGNNTVDVVGGRTIIIGSNISSITTVNLGSAPVGHTQANYQFVNQSSEGLTINGSTGADTITAGSHGDILIGNGGADTFVLNAAGSDVVRDTAADLNGTTIQNFSSLDSIDVTNVNFAAGVQPVFQNGSLTISDGTHTATIALLGQYSAAGFSIASDKGAGSVVIYTPSAQTTTVLAAAHDH
jgi:Ca2+-binding RTX toxin-like protein